MTLRGMDDGDLEELIARLETQTRYHALIESGRGRALVEQLRAQLTAARLERDQRACDE